MALQLFALTVFVLSYSDLIFAFPADLKINNGSDASIADHPWMVSLSVTLSTNISSLVCGGFLISPSWVVTAGHCGQREITHIRGGSNKKHSGGTLVEKDKVIVHPEFEFKYLFNDISLVRLKTPLIGENIEPIQLPEQDTELIEGDIANVAGFGMIDVNQQIYADTLQELNVSIVGFDTCRESYKDTKYPLYITENVICAESGKLYTGTCYGDSGSALVWNGKAVGIVSFGIDMCSDHYPFGFTKVSKYVNWINNIIGVNI